MPESADNFADKPPQDHLDQESGATVAPETLLDQILTPLLEDFNYWFDRSYTLLSTEEISFLSATETNSLLDRITTAQKELLAAKTLFDLSGHRVGVDAAAMRPWHKLLLECQAIAIRHRSSRA